MSVEVEEASVLHLIRDYLKEAGLCESLYALEVETGISPFAGRAAARRLALDGKWRELENALLQCEEGERGGEEGEKEDTFLQRARFVLVKQQYLEALARLDATAPHREPSEAELEQMLEYLEKLKQLAPSQEEYLALEALSAPDSSLHDHYSRWNLHSSRVECFSALMDWLRKWYLGAAGEERHSKHTKTTPHGSASQLVLLVAKGKLYEECEEICRQRCRGGEEASDSSEEAGSILNVSGWLQSQPEDMFQSAPLPVWIVTSPHNRPFSSPCNGRRPPATRATGCKLPPSIAVKESVDGTTETSTEDRGPKEKRGRVQGLSPASCPGGTPTQGAEVEEQVREHKEQVKRTTERLLENVKNIPKAMEHSHSSPPLQFEDNFSDFPAWLLQTTPLVHSLQQEGRDSSTPKPSTCPPPSSPPSSPVPHVSAVGVGLPSTPARHEHPPHKRGAMKGVVHPLSFKQIDFQQETGRESQSIEWPTASLAGTVRDTQVVRSVAFSQTGEVVAVGANSKILRLYSTSPLLDGTWRGKEMPVLYHHPHYHRGSIYCLAWWENSLLASGSNDKTIQLLCYRPPSETHPCTPRGQLGFHSGTVRELLFLPSGQLVSGGTGNPSLAVSDCVAPKMVGSLSGHTKQVLSLGLLRGSAVLSGGDDQAVRLWDPAQLQCVHTLTVGDTVTSLATHDQQLAVALADGSCSIYDTRNWKSLGSFQPHSSECRSVRYSPDGKWLLTGSYDVSVGLTEAASLEWVELAHHQDKVIQARWHPEGNLFASTSADKTACFWALQ